MVDGVQDRSTTLPNAAAQASPGPPLGERWARRLVCSRTGQIGELDRPEFLSPAGAPWLVEYDLNPFAGQRLKAAMGGRPWTLWRYRELLPLSDFEHRVDLGEGGTPLIPLRRFAVPEIEVLVKDEATNPTGSFKARGLAVAINRAIELGAPGVQLASAGNAALALTAYAAAAGLPARVALPMDTPQTVMNRCREHGAEVLLSPGTLVEAAGLLAGRSDGYWNLSTLREPYRAEGKKTMGFELVEQCGGMVPDWIVYPLGGGTGIVGMAKAFDELEALGWIDSRRPRMVAVQMEGCAPIVRAFAEGKDSAPAWENPHTEVWGLRVPKAIGDFLVLRALRATDGKALAIAEDRIRPTIERVARTEGIRLGPEGAAALAAAEDLAKAGSIAPGQRVIVFQTGDPGNYL